MNCEGWCNDHHLSFYPACFPWGSDNL